MVDRPVLLSPAIFTRHAACERINRQAKAPGIEHPNARYARFVANLNILISVLLTMRAFNGPH